MSRVSYWKGKQQSETHVAKRAAAVSAARKATPWKAGRPENTQEVLWSKVEKKEPHECWPWLGYVEASGYGKTWIGGKGYYAHRVIYSLANPGQITLRQPQVLTEWGFIRHTCDNRVCCNPAHLLVGTQKENSNDKFERGRAVSFKGAKASRAKLSENDVRQIRAAHATGFVTYRVLAIRYGVSIPTIGAVVSKRHYADVV